MFGMMSLRFCRWALVGSLIATPVWAADPPSGEPSAPPAAKSSPSGRATAQPAAAYVNGKPIPEAAVQATMQRLNVPPGQQAAARSQILGMLIDAKLIEGYLDQKKVTSSPELVDEQIRMAKRNVESQGRSWPEFLKANGLTEATVAGQVAQILQLRWETYLNQELTDKQIRDFFEANKNDLFGDEVRASHILIRVAPNASAEDRAAAKEKLEGIRKQIADGKLSFPDAVTKYSEDPTKNRGDEGPGDIGFFHRKGMMVEPFAKAAFELKKGEVSDVIQTPFGYHLIKITDRKPAENVPLEKVKGEVRKMMSDDLQKKIVDQERKTAKIQIAGAQPRPKG